MKLRALLPTVLLLVVGVVACGDDSPTGPISPEDTEFNPGLNIDLATFTELPSGVYIKTEVEGTGAEAAPGDVVTVSYELRLISNSQRRIAGISAYGLDVVEHVPVDLSGQTG